jgi:hypothetical protein
MYSDFSDNKNEPDKTYEKYGRPWKIQAQLFIAKYYSPAEHLAFEIIVVKGRGILKHIPNKRKGLT